MIDKLTRDEIAKAIYDSVPHYIGSMKDCGIAADAVLALQLNKQSDYIRESREMILTLNLVNCPHCGCLHEPGAFGSTPCNHIVDVNKMVDES